jgi:hypothetical protein
MIADKPTGKPAPAVTTDDHMQTMDGLQAGSLKSMAQINEAYPGRDFDLWIFHSARGQRLGF